MSAAPLQPINLSAKLAGFADHWNPRIVAELNGQHVRLAKIRGSFIWHRHEQEDELFLVLAGRMRMGIREAAGERWLELSPGEMIVIPRGMEHCPRSDPPESEAHLLLFEPATTLNTGNVRNERTRPRLERA